MMRNILNICIINSIFGPRDLSVLSSISKSNSDDKKIIKESEKQWFEWKIKTMTDTFNSLKRQFYAISNKLLSADQITEELENEQEFITNQKKSVLQKIKVIINELQNYPQLLQIYCVDQTKEFVIEILDFLRSQLYDEILFEQPYIYLIHDDFQLNHELLEIFIKIISYMDHQDEVRQTLQQRCLQVLEEKTEQIYRNNLTLFSFNEREKCRMQITKLSLLIRRQMEPLEKQADFLSYQLKLVNDVIVKTFHFHGISSNLPINVISEYEEELKKLQVELVRSLVLPWMVDMNSFSEYSVHDLEYILSNSYLDQRIEVLQQLIN
jgi:hypothetical protein